MPNKVESKLAIYGAEPVRTTLLPYGRQSVNKEDIEAVEEVLTSDWLTTGPEISSFEKSVGSFVGTKYAVAVSSGTAALHAAYFAAGISEGDEIVTTGMTFAATGNAALYLGARPVFADIDGETGNICPNSVKQRISPKTKAIVAVDYYGHPCDVEALNEIAINHDIKLIIDAAHSLGAEYKGKKAGSLADISTFSFHPVKSITCGEGGMILTDDKNIYEKAIQFRTHGVSKSATSSDEGSWYHEMQLLGFNYRITDFQCALGKSQLKRLPTFIKRRREIAAIYRKNLLEMNSFTCAKENDYCRSSYHLFPLLIAKEPYKETRRFVFDALRAENIGVHVHYIPVYQHPYYKVKYPEVNCPETDTFYSRQISLPIFPTMEDADVEDVVEALKKIDSELRE